MSLRKQAFTVQLYIIQTLSQKRFLLCCPSKTKQDSIHTQALVLSIGRVVPLSRCWSNEVILPWGVIWNVIKSQKLASSFLITLLHSMNSWCHICWHTQRQQLWPLGVAFAREMARTLRLDSWGFPAVNVSLSIFAYVVSFSSEICF